MRRLSFSFSHRLNYTYMKRLLSLVLLLAGLLIFASALQPTQSQYTSAGIALFKKDAGAFAASAAQLREAVAGLNAGDEPGRMNAVKALRACRLHYKRIETFMEYYFRYPVNLYNRAPVYELEEPYMEYQAPAGLQYIESLLLEPDAFSHKKELLDQCALVASMAAEIPSTLYGLKADDAGLMEANRLELIRISTLAITGYDAPRLKSGLQESAIALQAMNENLEPLLIGHPGENADALRGHLQDAIQLLQAATDFDRFDRLIFFTNAMLPLQEALAAFIAVQGLDVNTHPAINHSARHLFSPDAISLASFSAVSNNAQLAALGKELFSEKALSGNASRSCAACHRPEMAFTDGLVKSKSLDGKSVVMRNAPSLYYAAYQHSQFYDGRAASLEAQITAVLQSPVEMDANTDTVVQRLAAMPHYRAIFRKLWPDSPQVHIAQIAAALVAYEQTLAPFRSPFDRYMAGDTAAMGAAPRRGFNLFMGKAQCGSCHFAPLFNGLLPPYYERSELEVIGVPQRDAKGRQRADSDSGRYRFFPISFNNGAFKTTSVRNAGSTAPYMHNGVFKSLDEVLRFYNKGGGRGLGLKVPGQTLSDKPLGLTKAEIKDIITFLHALDDGLAAAIHPQLQGAE